MIEVKLIFRKAVVNQHSIEGLFSNIVLALKNSVKYKVHKMKFNGGSPVVILKNILKFYNLKSSKNEVYHITGDVHYLAISPFRKTVLTIHDIYSILTGNIISKTFKKIIWFWLPCLFVDKITVISEFTKNQLEEIVPFAKNKINVIPNPVSEDIKFYRKPFDKNDIKVLVVGTKENKNLKRIIYALKDLEITLLIVGYLSDKQQLLLDKNNIQYNNYFNVSYNKIIDLYYDADLLCFPSTYEGFGLPIVEAQKSGTPVITSNLCSMPEVANNTAILVDPYKVEEIRQAIIDICENEFLREDLINKGLQNIKRFELKAISNQYLTLYKELYHES